MSISVKVQILGALSKPNGQSELNLELEHPIMLSDMLLKIGYKKEHLSKIITLINENVVPQHTLLKNGDEVILTIIVGGG